MTAKETFEKLGFKFKEEMNTWKNVFEEEQITKHQFVYSCNASVDFKYSWLDVKFNLLKNNIEFFQHSMNGNSCLPPIGIDLWKAINKQVEELGWNKED